MESQSRQKHLSHADFHLISPSVCLRGTKVLGKCFLADPVKKTFHAASDDCIAKGGSLGTPLSGDENDQLYSYVRQSIGPEEHIWLGINDIVTDGQWVDQSGSNLRFKNWETEITLQPDGGRSQNCAILSTTANGKWFDESCRAEKASVCEFNIVWGLLSDINITLYEHYMLLADKDETCRASGTFMQYIEK